MSKERVGGSRTYHLKRRYGITAADADAMLAAQDGQCAVCRSALAVHVDHDHSTGKVRGLLCFNCNGGLGQFKDSIEVLEAAIGYLKWHSSGVTDLQGREVISSSGRRWTPVIELFPFRSDHVDIELLKHRSA